jgi:hypothetical protein
VLLLYGMSCVCGQTMDRRAEEGMGGEVLGGLPAGRLSVEVKLVAGPLNAFPRQCDMSGT